MASLASVVALIAMSLLLLVPGIFLVRQAKTLQLRGIQPLFEQTLLWIWLWLGTTLFLRVRDTYEVVVAGIIGALVYIGGLVASVVLSRWVWNRLLRRSGGTHR